MATWVDWLIGVDRGTIGDADWTIEWRNLPPTWVTVLLVVPVIVLFAALVYRRENKTAPKPARFFMSILRMLLILLLFLILSEPVLYMEWQNVKESYVVVLLDDSKSMTLIDKIVDHDTQLKLAKAVDLAKADEEKLSLEQERELAKLRRIDLLNRALANRMFDPKDGPGRLTTIEKLAERYNLRVYAFSDHLEEISGEFSKESAEKRKAAGDPPAPDLVATGESTAIGEMMAQVMNELRGQPVAAIVLFSDGRNTNGQDPVAWTRMQAEHGLVPPIYAVGVGNPADPRDIKVVDVTAPDVARARDKVEFAVKVKSYGFDGETVHISLQDKEGREVAGADLMLEGADKEQTKEIVHSFEKPGDFEIKLCIPPRPEEILDNNNSVTHHIKVVDHKIKVLFVDGYPRWEYRYLKNALIRDDTMVVSCFLQSADMDFPQEGSHGTPPLLAFPTDRKELFEYDVILMGDVDVQMLVEPDKVQETMQNLSDFVEDIGGGIAFMAGFRDDPKNYRNTPLAKLLPVVLEDSGSEGVGMEIVQTESFHPRLTEEGKRHSLMKLDEDPQVSARLWEEGAPDCLPGLFWFFQVKRAKPAAQVLAEHPNARNTQGKALPIVAVQPYGRGRTLFVGTDETWRWRFVRGDKYFYAFWEKAMEYLRGGKLLGGKKYGVETDKPAYTLGERVRIEALVRDDQYNLLTDPNYTATLETPSGVKKDIVMTLRADQKGIYEATYPADEVGVYQIWVGPDVIGEEKDRAYGTFEVKMPTREFEDPLMDKKGLESIAEASDPTHKTNARFLPLHDLEQLPELVKEPAEVLKPESKEKDLWNSPGVFLLFALLITLEWVLRKKFRLL